jgi:hypothetical protein
MQQRYEAQILRSREDTLNAAGFYRKKEWIGLTEQDVETIKKNSITWDWAILLADAKAKEKNT